MHEISQYSEINDRNIFKVIEKISKICKGAYSVIIMIANYGLICFKDPYGIRPLVLGKNKNSYIISSESSSISNLDDDPEIIKEINAGEIILLKKNFYNFNKKEILIESFKYCNYNPKPIRMDIYC